MTTKTAAPTGCEHCDRGERPTKLRRQYVHHDRATGRLVVCEVVGLKRAA